MTTPATATSTASYVQRLRAAFTQSIDAQRRQTSVRRTARLLGDAIVAQAEKDIKRADGDWFIHHRTVRLNPIILHLADDGILWNDDDDGGSLQVVTDERRPFHRDVLEPLLERLRDGGLAVTATPFNPETSTVALCISFDVTLT